MLDMAFGDPHRGHPVAGFGRMAGALEARMWGPSRRRGAAYAAVLVAGTAGVGAAADRATRRRPLLRVLVTGVATWLVLGGRSLRREGMTLGRNLMGGDLPGARERLPALCGRDPSALDETELARPTVESLAENTSDAVVAPLVWGAVAGVPGLLGYRAANTLDAMVGHRTPRHERFGWAAARLDDVLNLAPARLTGALAVACAPPGSRHSAWQVLGDDGAAHPSPNAGRCEAAFAGALGVRLGGRNVYAGRVDERPVLGVGGRPCLAADVGRAARLSRRVETAAVALTVTAALARPW